MDRMSIRILPASARAGAGQTWSLLERATGSTSVASSWDWTEAWLEHYSDVVPHRFALGDEEGVPQAIALLTYSGRQRGPFSIRRVHIGTSGEPPGESVRVEYNRVLSRPGREAAYANVLLKALAEEPDWDALVLDGFAVEALDRLRPAIGALEVRESDSPFLDLRQARGGEVLDLIRDGPRRRIRRAVARFGTLEAEWAETEGDALEVLRELASLHQRRWTAAGQPGAFASERFTGFHQALVRRLAPARAVLFRVRNAQGTVGCLYLLVEGRRLLFYQGGFAAFEDNKLKPGLVTHTLCMQAALERGYEHYDFLAGEERYKSELSSGANRLAWARMTRRRLKSRFLDALRRGPRAIGRAW